MKLPLIILALLISLLIALILFPVFVLAEIYINYGQVRAHTYHSTHPIPNGLAGVAIPSKHEKYSKEWWREYCNSLYPKPCNALDRNNIDSLSD